MESGKRQAHALHLPIKVVQTQLVEEVEARQLEQSAARGNMGQLVICEQWGTGCLSPCVMSFSRLYSRLLVAVVRAFAGLMWWS